MGDHVNFKQDSKSSLPYGSNGKRKVVSRRSCKKVDKVLLPTLSDKKLEKMTIKELNDYTREISKHQAQELKKRRRILKNRRYALKCRVKSIQKSVSIKEENLSLEKELSAAKRELKTIVSERDNYKSKYVQLYNHVFETFSASTAIRASKLAN